jgi:hypothetical protein
MPAANPAKDAKALSHRARGWTYQRIATEMGYRDRSAARKAVERAITQDVRESNEAAKTLLLADLNAAKQEIWAVMDAHHVTISNGIVVRIDGEPVPDDDPVYRGVDRLVRIDQELAKIYGAYAPVQSRVEVITADVIESEIARLEGELNANDPADSGTA